MTLQVEEWTGGEVSWVSRDGINYKLWQRIRARIGMGHTEKRQIVLDCWFD